MQKIIRGRIMYAMLVGVFLMVWLAATDTKAAMISLLQAIDQNPHNFAATFSGANSQATSNVDIISTGTTSDGDPTFTSRYSFHRSLDLDQIESSASASTTSQYTLLFVVNALPGEQWQLNIDTRRQGASTKVFDGNGGGGEVSSTSVTANLLGATIESGSLTLPAIDLFNSPGSLPFNQTSFATTGVNIGSAIISLQFSFDTFLKSDGTNESCNPFTGCIPGSAGSEVAFRLGLPNLFSTTTAGNYPGLDNRDITQDGHFVTVSAKSLGVSAVPIPSSLSLFATGLVGLIGYRKWNCKNS